MSIWSGAYPMQIKRRGDDVEPKRAHEQALEGFTLYCKPDDYPRHWVVRGWRVLGNGALAFEQVPTLFDCRKDAEAFMQPKGLHWINRHHADALCVVGSWI